MKLPFNQLLCFLCLSVLPVWGWAQTLNPAPAMVSQAQSLSLRELLEAAAIQNPDIRAARLAAQANEQDVTAVERLRWPTLSLTAESDTGNNRTTPNTALQVEQTLYDFGQLSARIAGAKTEASTGLLRMHLQQQDVYLQIIGAWQSLLGAQQRAQVARDTLQRLDGFVAQMTRRVESKASAPIDLELVQARVLQTEVELSTAQNAASIALNRIEQLTGLSGVAARLEGLDPAPWQTQAQAFANELDRIDWVRQASQSSLVAKARLDVERARTDYQLVVAQNFPTLYLRSYQPLSKEASGVPLNTSMTTFFGLRYSPGAGFVTAAQAQSMQTRLSSVEEKVRSATQEMLQIMRSDREEFMNARLRQPAHWFARPRRRSHSGGHASHRHGSHGGGPSTRAGAAHSRGWARPERRAKTTRGLHPAGVVQPLGVFAR